MFLTYLSFAPLLGEDRPDGTYRIEEKMISEHG